MSADPLLAPTGDGARPSSPCSTGGAKHLFVLIDNFRYDQWRALGPALADRWQVQSERMHWSIPAHRHTIRPQRHLRRHGAQQRIAQAHSAVVEG